MADVIAKKFEVGRSSTGAAAIQTWIAANIAGGSTPANKLIALLTYKVDDVDFTIAVMSTTKVVASPTVAMTNPLVAEFEIKEHDFTPMLTWINAQSSTVIQKMVTFERGKNQVFVQVVLSN